jgi:hypothetical protein
LLAELHTADIDFLTVEQEHPIWGMMRARNEETSASFAESVQENMEVLMQNAQNARTPANKKQLSSR